MDRGQQSFRTQLDRPLTRAHVEFLNNHGIEIDNGHYRDRQTGKIISELEVSQRVNAESWVGGAEFVPSPNSALNSAERRHVQQFRVDTPSQNRMASSSGACGSLENGPNGSEPQGSSARGSSGSWQHMADQMQNMRQTFLGRL